MKKAGKIVSSIPDVYVFFIILLGAVFRIACANWSQTYSTDLYYYVVKGFEILRGNLQPMPSLAIGWPYVLAGVFAILSPETYIQGLNIARFMSLLFDILTVCLIFLTAKSFMGPVGRLSAVVLYVWFPLSVIISVSGMPDSAFAFFFMLGIWAVLKKSASLQYSMLSGAAAAACVWIRPNGILVIPVSMLLLFMHRGGLNRTAWNHAFVFSVIAICLGVPMWAGRMAQFGNPFSYGPATKLFVTSLDQSLSPNIQNPAATEFFRSVSLAGLVETYVLRGTREFVRSAVFPFGIFDAVSAFIFSSAVAAFFLLKKPAAVNMFSVVFAYWVLSLVPTMPVHQKSRHLLPLVPVAVLIAIYVYKTVFTRMTARAGYMAVYGVLGILAAAGITASYGMSQAIRTMQSGDTHDWARWSAGHMTGTVVTMDSYAIQERIIDRLLAETSHSQLMDLPGKNIRFSFPGYFTSLTDELQWLRSMGVTYIILDREYLRRAPYLRDIAEGKVRISELEPVWNNQESDNPWKVSIFAVH